MTDDVMAALITYGQLVMYSRGQLSLFELWTDSLGPKKTHNPAKAVMELLSEDGEKEWKLFKAFPREEIMLMKAAAHAKKTAGLRVLL